MSKHRDPLSVKVDFLRHGTYLHSYSLLFRYQTPDYVNPPQSNRHRHFIDSRMEIKAREANRTTVYGAEIQKQTTHLSGTLLCAKLLRIPLHSQVRVF